MVVNSDFALNATLVPSGGNVLLRLQYETRGIGCMWFCSTSEGEFSNQMFERVGMTVG